MNGLLLGRVGVMLAVTGSAAGVTWAVTDGGADHITTAGPSAWVDDPLDGSVLASDVDEVIVVAHATDPEGIVAVVLSVDGDEIDTATTSGDALVLADDLRWSPRGPGTYELTVVGRDPSGAATPPGTATVQVGSDAEQPTTTTTSPVAGDSTSSTESGLDAPTSTDPTSTASTSVSQRSRPEPTTTPSATSTTPPIATTTTQPITTTTCVPGRPTNTSPPDGAVVATKTPTLQWTYSGCPPELFQIEISRDASFLRVEPSGRVAGAERQWTPPPLACDISFWFRVRAELGASAGAWSAPTSFTASFRGCV